MINFFFQITVEANKFLSSEAEADSLTHTINLFLFLFLFVSIFLLFLEMVRNPDPNLGQ